MGSKEKINKLAKDFLGRELYEHELSLFRHLDYVARNDNHVWKDKLYPGEEELIYNLEKEKLLLINRDDDRYIKVSLKRSFFDFLNKVVIETVIDDFLPEDYFEQTHVFEELPEYAFTYENKEQDNSCLMHPIETWDRIVGYRKASKTNFAKSFSDMDDYLVMFEDKEFRKYWIHIGGLSFEHTMAKLQGKEED